MNRRAKQILLLCLLFCKASFSQYILNGSAQKNSCNCYTLTQAVQTQTGSVWNGTKISLNNSFDFWFNVFLGCNDGNGADGIVFMLQPISTSVGTSGEGMGFEGVSPSIGISLDTWQNTNRSDPFFDHIGIQANGQVTHGNDLAGPVSASVTSDNIEDCQWHKLRIKWDATAKRLQAYFDGVLRVEKQIDLVATIFNNDPNVYWGFSGATGGAVNLQQFCTALDPIFTTNFTANVACEGSPVVFTNASESFAPIVSYNWSFGDGTSSTVASPPPHLYPAPGDYKVNLKIKGQDGCERDSTKTITVAANPSAALQVFDTCEKKAPRIFFPAPGSTLTTEWTVDGAVQTGASLPDLTTLAPGTHKLQVDVRSPFGCGRLATAAADFTVLPLPTVEANVQDACVNEPVFFEGLQTDALTTIQNWKWRVGAAQFFNSQNVQTSFSLPGNYPVRLWAIATNGCSSDTVEKSVRIAQAFLLAKDTSVMRNQPAQLNVRTNGSVVWSPPVGLSDAFVANPTAILSTDQTFTITATTPEGCTAMDTMRVKVFTGPTVYVPSAFSPNGDGKNDLFLPVYVGMKELRQFSVFNRWGQKVFETASTARGWDGRDASGTYVWLVQAVDYRGHSLTLKGTVTVIR